MHAVLTTIKDLWPNLCLLQKASCKANCENLGGVCQPKAPEDATTNQSRHEDKGSSEIMTTTMPTLLRWGGKGAAGESMAA